VVTTISNVKEENRQTAVPADLGLLPPKVATKLAETGETLVIVGKDEVVDPTEKTIELVNPKQDWAENAVGIGLGVANS
ncbi:MAG: hypothetical protein VW270_18505, partial [Candidatus Poseidoniales archaeon]